MLRGVRLPSLRNPVGHSQLVSAIQFALVVVVGLTREAAKLRKGHALRVGGSNYMRQLGISDEVHRKLGGWMSLVSSHGYMHMSVGERSHIKGLMSL